METNWRLAQVFLSAQAAGVFEVEINPDTAQTRCTCPVWKSRQNCKHTRYVAARVKANNGHYSLALSHSVLAESIERAKQDPEAFRTLVLHHGRVEVL